MKVIIAGSRDINSIEIVRMVVLASGFDITEVVSGGARGVDTLGEQIAEEEGYSLKIFPANWNLHGKKAGILRNIEMGQYADALIAIQLNDSKGTEHMINYTKRLGKPVYVHKMYSCHD